MKRFWILELFWAGTAGSVSFRLFLRRSRRSLVNMSQLLEYLFVTLYNPFMVFAEPADSTL